MNLSEEPLLLCIPTFEILQDLESQLHSNCRFIFVSFDDEVCSYLRSIGFHQIFQISPTNRYIHLNSVVKKVLIFEDEIPATCKMIQLISRSTSAPIIVITKELYKLRLYYSVGAKYVIHSKSTNYRFLLHEN
ncbi:hypothetical protein EKG37_21160 [Robertmurraya yapensis]|uniref:Uncharacterized protein n=1 Tax=Bacillus yapensis TaxID=2492960 RepID=A0A431VTN6_9BACI|nr:hypothetical protein [Bacillus yapensis]RTR26580.1 hypothetical protein EKG37_21160 [Bacillus yapensis]TKS93755.1 hypothetical protein FAR12_21165 [Bacillus yapensis]